MTIFFVFISLCCSGQDVEINTQIEMDAFDPNTTVINGNLSISGIDSNDPIINLNNLSNLTSVNGELSISWNDLLTNVDGLSSLSYVGKHIYIQFNDALTNLDGLSNLTHIEWALVVTHNASLINIDGLSNLAFIGQNLSLQRNNVLSNIDGLSNITSLNRNVNLTKNDALTNIDGLSNLTSIGGNLVVFNNDALTNIDGFSNLVSISESLDIKDNNTLMNLDAFSNLTSINGRVLISQNYALTSIDGLSNIVSIGGHVYLQSNSVLDNIDALSNLTFINGDLWITQNSALTNIDAFSNLVSINGDLWVSQNDALSNIDGFSNLISIGGNLSIIADNNIINNIDALSNLTSIGGNLDLRLNHALTNLDGLHNLISIGGNLWLEDNSNLTNCCGIQNLLNTPGAISGNISISNNPSECSNQNQILTTFCGLSIKIFNDISQDCIDNNEIGISNRQFIIQPGNIIGETDASGYWSIDSLPQGNYTVTIDTSGTWSPTCPFTQSFTVVNPIEETIMPSFGLISTEPCTALDINIHMPFMRPCFQNQKIYVQTCNTYDATGALEDAFVVIELDSLLIPTSSSIPYTDLGDHMYQFDIGTLNPGICTDFWIETTLSCDAALGQGLCMEANLFPAEDCVFDDVPHDTNTCNTSWDMSSLDVKGSCVNDSIFFEIINSGSGDMTCFSLVRIYINGNLIILDSVQLLSGEIATFSFSGDGQSWRLEVDQHPLHPGNSQPNALVENCGGTVQSLLSFVNAMPLDDADPIVDIYCGIVTGSYDPNDKTGFPLGVNESNDILPNQKIEYLIRFQNTGTDTAFTVVIRDTLSTDFDIFSVQSGVASHAYDFTINNSRAMEWTFNNILLPDSTTNEAGSHGFIKFTVNQIPDLAEGTILKNTAAIYFDFNDPIITNTSQHTINYFTPNIIATTNISEEGCDDYISPSGNYTWTNSGTYYDLIETENGDSIIIVDLAITSSGIINPTIAYIGDNTITANIPNAEYQWLDCNNNLNPIEGATEQNFITTETIGNYAIQITLDGCTVISDCFSLNTTGTMDYEFANAISIQPNPTNNHVSVILGQDYQATSFTLRNILGQIILKRRINTSNEFYFEIEGATGLYLLEIETDSGENATFKILKN